MPAPRLMLLIVALAGVASAFLPWTIGLGGVGCTGAEMRVGWLTCALFAAQVVALAALGSRERAMHARVAVGGIAAATLSVLAFVSLFAPALCTVAWEREPHFLGYEHRGPWVGYWSTLVCALVPGVAALVRAPWRVRR